MCHLILFLPAFALPLFWVFPMNTALPLYLFILGISLILYFKVFEAMRQQVRTGQEAMVGRRGLVVQDIDPEGKVVCVSEIWHATTLGKPLLKGEKVKVSRIKGLRLLVEEWPTEGEVK